MTLLKVIILCAVVFGGYTYMQRQQTRDAVVRTAEVAESPSTFVALPAAQGHDRNTVVVLAPSGCTRSEAMRAENLATELERAGVRVQRSSSISFAGADPAEAGRIQSVMEGPVPIVFVRGKGKADPSFNEVMAEFNRR